MKNNISVEGNLTRYCLAKQTFLQQKAEYMNAAGGGGVIAI